MEPKIVMLSSSAKLAELARSVAGKIGVHMEIKTATFERAVQIGKDLESKGADVIISRGGTAALLRNNLSIPVLPIPISAFDYVENVIEATKYGKNIGISIYGASISGIEVFEHHFQVKIRQIIYEDPESLHEGILQAVNEGVKVIIGGNFSLKVCQKVGLPCILMSSTEGTIRNVIEEAKLVASIRRQEEEKTRRTEAIINSVSEGIIAIDNSRRIVVFNKAAREILKINEFSDLNANSLAYDMGLHEIIRKRSPSLQDLKKIGEVQVMTNLMPVYLGEEIIGAIASFSEVSKVIRAEQKVRSSFTRGFSAKYTLGSIVYKSHAMKHVIDQTVQFSCSDSTVLITGESGTGKELLAHAIHNLSPRNKWPFVAINCLSIPENLLESELFGYEEGAFTGAKKGGKMGLFELAHRGSIFLDEIGSISEPLQTRLLRVLEQKEVMKIGGDRIIKVNVRIIAATNKDLLNEIMNDKFRMDLYFRFNILNIQIPPLRERKEDIFPLFMSSLDFFAKKYGKKMERIPKELSEMLLGYSWPGNVRELENFVERFVLVAKGPDQYEAVIKSLLNEFQKAEELLARIASGGSASTSDNDLNSVIQRFHTKKGEIAKKLGVSRATLWRRTKRGRYN
jgi:transcriptional regulator with PAS, ATPase and Fis domain